MTLEKMWEESTKIELGRLDDTLDEAEYARVVDAVTKMMDRHNKAREIELEKDKFEVELSKLEIERAKAKTERWDAVAKNVLTGVSIATGIGLAVWGTTVSMKFEKEDTFTSLLGRKWVDKTLSFMKK